MAAVLTCSPFFSFSFGFGTAGLKSIAFPSSKSRVNANVNLDAKNNSMQAAQHAPPPSLTEIFREYAPFAWRALRRLGIPESDVEDVCQEVFVVVHRKLGDFEGRSSLKTWIYGICARTASDYRRSGRVRREIVTDAPPEGAHEASQHDALVMRQARQQLDRILDQLDDDKRSVFVLYEIEELTMAEVSEALGCPLQTAYSRLHSARKIVEAAVQQAKAKASLGDTGGVA